MAVTVLTSIGLVKGVCLSTDTKPTSWGIGSTLYETDTDLLYIFDGPSWSVWLEA